MPSGAPRASQISQSPESGECRMSLKLEPRLVRVFRFHPQSESSRVFGSAVRLVPQSGSSTKADGCRCHPYTLLLLSSLQRLHLLVGLGDGCLWDSPICLGASLSFPSAEHGLRLQSLQGSSAPIFAQEAPVRKQRSTSNRWLAALLTLMSENNSR